MLPFQDDDLEEFNLSADVNSRTKVYKQRTKKAKTPKPEEPQIRIKTIDKDRSKAYYLYFENSDDDHGLLYFPPYTGPCNTMHLNKQLYLPQLIQITSLKSDNNRQLFIEDYNRAVATIPPASNASIGIFMRFGIMYLVQRTTPPSQTLPIKDFIDGRNRDKQIKTSFYTSKGVTSPKNLLKAMTREGFSRSAKHTYTYEIQLFATKKDHSTTYHFRYDENLCCTEILHRPSSPINFDVIRDKSSSRFRSLDDSYADLFDFRIQVQQIQRLSKEDSGVLAVLHGIPIDEVLYMDQEHLFLSVASALRASVKYMKCIRSSQYVSSDKSTSINIGSYEEFRLNERGMCEASMKSENTMTIELLHSQTVPPAESLYDLGMWFSSLCQQCVDLPNNELQRKMSSKPRRWFSRVFDAWKRTRTVKKVGVNELTQYTTKQVHRSYSYDELAFVKRILYTNDWLEMFPKNPNALKKELEVSMQRLKGSEVPLAVDALKKLEKIYLSVTDN